MMEYNMVAILESKIAAISGLFLHIFASGVIRNLIIASKHMYLAMGNTFLQVFESVGNQGGGHIGIQNGCYFKFHF